MNLLRVVFELELKQLFRQYWILGCLAGLIVVSLLGFLWGMNTVEKRMEKEESIRSSYREDYENVLGLFADTLTESGRATAENAGMIAMVNYRLPQPTIKETQSLAPLALGMMDVQPWYKMVKNTRSFGNLAETPVSNPSILETGSFDYSLVLVYLIPLLVFAFSFSLYASEKESGTLSLLAIQQGNVFRVIRMRLLFRFLLLLITVLFLNGIIALMISGPGAFDTRGSLWWNLLTLIYLVFWFAVSYFILSLKKNAVTTALMQIAAWLFFAVIYPGVVIAYAQANVPVPLKDEISSYRRIQGEEIWSMHPAAVSDSFNVSHPEYASTADLAKDTLPLSDRYVAGYYDLLERRMLKVLGEYQEGIDRRNSLIAGALSLNPLIRTEAGYIKLSGNDLESYQDFYRQSDDFQKEWQGFLYPYHFREEHLVPSDFEKFPVFNYRTPALHTRDLSAVLTLLAISSLLMIVLADWLGRRPDTSTY